MKKQIMSIAAAAALLTSGAMAFETNQAGALLDLTARAGSYVNDTDLIAPAPIDVTMDLSGDALIFPAFTAEDGWNSEIVVRNNQDYAVVAKLVAYSAHDSQELRDFNIYLSANDVFRAQIIEKDGKTYIVSDDDSVNIDGFGKGINIEVPESTGYIVVYGQFEAPTVIQHSGDAVDPKQYIYKTYKTVLDDIRHIDGNNEQRFPYGVYKMASNHGTAIQAPKVDASTVAAYGIQSVSDNTLSGTIRISNASDSQPRDMVMPATAIENYTETGYIMLWAERELAAFADRNIVAVAGGVPTYDAQSVLNDAQAYAVTGNEKTFYTFSNKLMGSEAATVENKMIFTQVLKRTLVQLNVGGYWSSYKKCTEKVNLDSATKVKTGAKMGTAFLAKVWDEAEVSFSATTPPVSPGPIVAPQVLCKEIAEVSNLEIELLKNTSGEGKFNEKNGYVSIEFSGGLPVIPTQMSASKVGGSAKINWIQAPVN